MPCNRSPQQEILSTITTISLVNEHQELVSKTLMRLRSEHDSQARSQKGNEGKKGQPHMAVEKEGDAISAIDPRLCSKIVSIIVRDAEGLEKAVARKHRWNINVKLDISKLARNSSKNLNVTVQNMYKVGEVSKDNSLENGKFVVIIKGGVRILLSLALLG